MADHFDAVSDLRHDITDLYIFQKPGDPAKSILIMNVNPEAPTLATMFDPEASYEFKLDTNAEAQAETVYRATGEAAQDTGHVGEVIIPQAPVSFDREAQITTEGAYRFYAGIR